jgi:hypothetical protein
MPINSFQPQAFVEHFKKIPPNFLYHYTGQAGLLGIIKTGELWATKIQYMNDATEFGLALTMARKELDATLARSNSLSEKASCARLKESLSGLEDINIFAVCFCENGIYSVSGEATAAAATVIQSHLIRNP